MSKTKQKDTPKAKPSKPKLSEDALGNIYQSMEKLSNAICIENGLYRGADLSKSKSKTGTKLTKKTVRFTNLAKKKTGKDIM